MYCSRPELGCTKKRKVQVWLQLQLCIFFPDFIAFQSAFYNVFIAQVYIAMTMKIKTHFISQHVPELPLL